MFLSIPSSNVLNAEMAVGITPEEYFGKNAGDVALVKAMGTEEKARFMAEKGIECELPKVSSSNSRRSLFGWICKSDPTEGAEPEENKRRPKKRTTVPNSTKKGPASPGTPKS